MTGKRRAGRDPIRPPAKLSSPTSPEVVIQPTSSRRQARLERKRRQRRKLGLAGGIAVVVIGVVILTTIAFGVHEAVTKGGGPSRTQTTLLLQIQGGDRTAAGTVLLAHDPATKQGLEVLVPNRLITDVCGYGSQNFGDVLALPNGAAASRSALSTVLGGVTIDGSWVLQAKQFETLVSAIGGVTVDVDTNVIRRTAGGGGRILVAQGAGRHLSGQQALEYATYQTSAREDAAAQLARLQEVVDAMVQALPHTETGIGALVRRLGPGGTSTLGAAKLSRLLAGLAADDRTEAGVFPTDLPVSPIDAGGPPSYHADQSATGIPQLVQTRLADSLPAGAGKEHATVFVLNGVGTPGLVATACPKLAAHGFTYAGSNNAPSFSQAKSQVEIFSDAAVEQGRELARALGLPAFDVRRSTVNQTVAKFVVILGSDYKP